MKKLVSLMVVAMLLATMLAGCGAGAKDYTLGIGMALSGAAAKYEVSTTVAGVVLDKDGKVVLCRLDNLDAGATMGDDGLEVKSEYKSKAALGDSYGMLSEYGSKLAEWHTQAKFFENYVAGKTRDEIAAIKTGDAELVSGCTIDVSDFVKAIVAACDSERKVAFTAKGDLTAGVSILASVSEKNEKANYTSDVAAIVMSEGKVACALIDSADATIEIGEDKEGKNFSTKGSKLQLGDSYGMVQHGQASAEWYVQAQNYAKTAVGKAQSELASLATENVSGCTIALEGYKKAMILASEYVR